ncbi:MAG: L-threonylcarbamoyladenylate synthase [Thermoplasmata archaeon]|nr:L-threonylcarbamoyladenylate synthase [Thermoplasmata archaeon]
MRDALADAAGALSRGKLVVYPTDTLLGLGACATSRAGVERLAAAKGRPGGMPLSVAFSSLEEVEPYVTLSEEARSFCRRRLPGPITALAPATPLARRRLAGPILGAGRSLGFRVPDHPVARELARRVGPIVCTSANRHGEPPVADLASARRVFGREVAVYLPLFPPPSGTPSRLVDLSGPEPREIPRGGGSR